VYTDSLPVWQPIPVYIDCLHGSVSQIIYIQWWVICFCSFVILFIVSEVLAIARLMDSHLNNVDLIFSPFQEWANAMARRPSSFRPSVCPSVNFCANRFFSQTNSRIATKLSQDGLQVSMHPGCAQGQRSRDTHTFLDFWNELLRHWRSGCWNVIMIINVYWKDATSTHHTII